MCLLTPIVFMVNQGIYLMVLVYGTDSVSKFIRVRVSNGKCVGFAFSSIKPIYKVPVLYTMIFVVYDQYDCQFDV